jgi:phosphoribosylanthranilate isomerase
MVAVKICGINEPSALKAAVKNGANYVGLVFYPPSPRCVEIEMAQALSGLTPDKVKVVGVFVDPSDDEVKEASQKAYLDYIQLHGNETPERVKRIKTLTGLPVIKAFRIAHKDDLKSVSEFDEITDLYLFDARPEEDTLPGGTGQSFDWNILAGKAFNKPWFLSGGLNSENVTEALELLDPDVIDLSSGVEISPGEKSSEKIRDFFDTLKAAGKLRPSYLEKI